MSTLRRSHFLLSVHSVSALNNLDKLEHKRVGILFLLTLFEGCDIKVRRVI